MLRLRDALAEAAETANKNVAAERIRAIGQRYVEFAQSDPHLFRAIFAERESDESGPEAHALREAGLAAFGILVTEIAASLGESDDTLNVQETAFACWVFVHGQAVLSIDEHEGAIDQAIDRDAIMHWTVQAILASIKKRQAFLSKRTGGYLSWRPQR
ncbi:MAG: TetR-like C-terminal domain-containing protein [Pseudomonadota bacterium]